MLKRASVLGACVAVLAVLVACVGDDASSGQPAGAADASPNGGDGAASDSASGNDSGTVSDGGEAAALCTGKTCKAGFACIDGHCGNEAKSVAIGLSFTCTLLWGGEVWCWGATDMTQVGAPALANDPQCGARTCRTKPAAIPSFADVVQLATGYEHACAVKVDGSVWCWGDNTSGQLAQAASVTNAPPTQVQGFPAGTKVVQVTCGQNSSCARTASGTVYCWGSNEDEQLGIPRGSGTSFRSPQLVAGIAGAVDIGISFDRGSREHACVLGADKKLSCWGGNANNELGHGGGMGSPPDAFVCLLPSPPATYYCNDTPEACAVLTPPPATPVTGFSVAPAGTCAIHGGDVKCWGDNRFYQLGTGAPVNSSPAITIAGLPAGSDPDPVASIRMRGFSGFAITKSGDAWGWGLNAAGVLALAATDNVACTGGASCRVATKLTSVGKVVDLATGVEASVALRQDGTVVAWGANDYGQLGHMPDPSGADNACGGTRPCAVTPVVVTGLP